MKRYMRWVIVGAMVLGLAALLGWSYSYTSPMTPRASEEWSRGRVVGQTPVSRPVAIQPAPGGGVYLVWPNMEGRLEMAHIGANGKVLLNRTLPLETEEARDPQLRVGDDGRLHLLWREEGEGRGAIYYALLREDGEPIREPQMLSDPQQEALDRPRWVRDEQGRLHAIWADRSGIRWAVLSQEGEVLRPPTLLVPEARSPAAQCDGQGRLHLAWQQRVGGSTQGIYYAALDLTTGEMGTPEEITLVFLRTGQVVEGPEVGLDLETGYVLWAVQDLREVSSEGRYAFFPLDLPRQKRVKAVRLEYGASPTGLSPLEGQETVLLVALSETVRGEEGQMGPQIAVLALARDQAPEYEVWGVARVEGGQSALFAPAPKGAEERQSLGWEGLDLRLPGEHLVSASSRPSIKPAICTDEHLYLHLAWLETGGFGQYRVVYASTAPEVKHAYNALTLWDVTDAIFSGVLRLSSVVLTVVPMLVLWALLPLMGLLVYHLATGEEGLERLRSRLMLGAALALEIALTFVFPPRTDLPWPVLRWVIPAATACIAAIATFRFSRRRGDSLLFTSFFFFTAVHGLLQLTVYTFL